MTGLTLFQPLNQIPAWVLPVAGPQTSTASTAVVTGTDIEVSQMKVLSYTAIVATHDVDWSVFGANVSDFSDEVAVLAATKIVLSGVSSYSASPPPYRYYRVKVIDDVGGTHGTITINGIARG